MKKYILLILILFVISVISYNKYMRFNHPESYKIENFVLAKQPDDITCGPTSALMVLKSYGKEVNLDEVKSKTKTKWFEFNGKSIGMTHSEYLPIAMNDLGVPVRLTKGHLDQLKYYVSESRPPIVLLRSGKTTWHYVVVIGYTKDTIIIADPGNGKEKEMIGTFEGAWAFDSDMRGNSIEIDCPLCKGSGKINNSIRQSDDCYLCSGTGGGYDALKFVLQTAEVYPFTMIVPKNKLIIKK